MAVLASPSVAAADVANCPAQGPSTLWGDFSDGSVGFRQEVFARPGVLAATTGAGNGAALRAGGAQTAFWQMRLADLVGTPAAPVDATTVLTRTATLLEEARATTGCSQPLIVLNELEAPSAQQPWSAGMQAYRSAVLALVTALQGQATPYLLAPATPAVGGHFNLTGGETWWKQVGALAYVVPEVYFDANAVHAQPGEAAQAKYMRLIMRGATTEFVAAGVPPSRLGLTLGFQSGTGQGGRERLHPTAAWLNVVKLQAFAAGDVATDTGLAAVWSWGWGTFATAGSADPDKAAAACAYLWARAPELCADAGESGLLPDRASGRLVLADGVECTVDGTSMLSAQVDSLARAFGRRDFAIAALLASDTSAILPARLNAVERDSIVERYAGSRSRYEARLESAGIDAEARRVILTVQLMALDQASREPVPIPAASLVRAWRSEHRGEQVRVVTLDRPVAWFQGRRRIVFPLSRADAVRPRVGLPLAGLDARVQAVERLSAMRLPRSAIEATLVYRTFARHLTIGGRAAPAQCRRDQGQAGTLGFAGIPNVLRLLRV